MTTLYVSDLDGTLLNSNQTLSPFTIQTINQLVSDGMLFSYATARSYQTAKKVTQGLQAPFPLIVYNGACVRDNVSGEILLSHCFQEDIHLLLDHFLNNHLYPIVYAFIDGEEKFSFIPEKCTPGMLEFIESRKGDPRIRIIHHLKAFVKGVRGYFSYYLRRFSLCFCLNNAFQSVLSSQTATMVKKHFDFIICFALLNHKNSIRFIFLRMVIWGG